MAAPQLTVSSPGLGVVSADQLNTYEQTCDNAAQLRAFIGIPGVQVFIRGITGPNDGNAGAFYWNATSTAIDDNLTVIAPSGLSVGRWLRVTLYSGTGGSTAISSLTLQNASGSSASLVYSTTSGGAASTRWTAYKDNAVESGSNAGSNYQIAAFSDTGVFLNNAFSITRSTQVANFIYLPTVGGSNISYNLSPFQASGTSHSVGAVPDPGNVAGSTRFLREDATWATPSSSGSGVPTGAIQGFPLSTAQTGWLYCNGAAVSRATYAALFAYLSTTFGIGDGSTTFNLPNYRGAFIRGYDDSYGLDTQRSSSAVGTATVTMASGSPGVITWTSHGLQANQPVYFTTTGTLPAAVTSGVIYYVVGSSITTNTFQIASAPAGSAINFATSSTATTTGTSTPKWEADTVGPHTHVYQIPSSSGGFASGANAVHYDPFTSGTTTGQSPASTVETRPGNFGVYWFIKT